jgi:dienelactone hydrolase
LIARCLIGATICCQAVLAPSASRAAALDLPFTLSKPAGDGPFPAVVLMHDCSGLGSRSSGAPWRWSSFLTAKGYVTIWPDSFSTRGHPRGVCTDASPPRILPSQRAADAYAALDHLRTLPFVDAKRIALMGGSHGGSTTLAAIVDTPRNARPDGAQFAAAIALYPGCGRSMGGWSVARTNGGHDVAGYSGVFKPLAPLLILIGERDDWTPAEPCRRLAAAAQAAGQPVEIVVYPGAHHSFDSPARQVFVAERRNINSPTGQGATTAGDPKAWADAMQRVEGFLAAHLGGGAGKQP